MPEERLIIVVEGRTDVLIIRAILHAELRSWTRFFAGQGRESLITLARNVLVHEGGPVLLVMEVATADLPSRDERVAEAMRALSTFGAPGMFQVFTFVPEIEVVFFEAPDALQRALQTTLPAQVLVEGQARPKEALRRLMAEGAIPNLDALIRKHDEEALDFLSRGRQAKALREMVRAFCRLEVSADA